MIKFRYIATSVGTVAALSIGVASAATSTSNHNSNIGTSGISRSVYKQERIDAVSQVLNTSSANLKSAKQHRNLAQLIKNAGLTKKTFRQKVKAQLTSDLEAKGYTLDQITIALQHRTIVRLRHHR